MLVVDASVVVKALTEEVGSDAATALLLAEDVVAAPTLVTLEVAAALSRKVRYHDLPPARAHASLDALPQFINEYVATDDLIVAAFDLSIALRHAIQDCLYLALAIERDCPVVTADLKFAAAARAGGHADRVVILDVG